MTNYETFLNSGLITVLIFVVGYFGKQIYQSVKNTEAFVIKQGLINTINDTTLNEIDETLDTHRERLDDHHVRISKTETEIKEIKRHIQ